MNMRISETLPRIAALVVWGLTLPQLGTFGGQRAGPSAFTVVIGIALATLLILLAQSPKLRGSGLVLWLSGGVWTGAAYISTEVIGLAYFLVAFLTIGSAALRERERGKFSLSGPAAFIAAMLVMIVASNVLSGQRILELADKRILVTGANGFIGSHVVALLAENEGVRVHALVRKMPAEPKGNGLHPSVKYIQGDVTDRDAVVRAVAGCDIVIHTAACQPLAPLPRRSQFMAVNVGGTENLLLTFEPPGEGRFLLMSTINVHGLPPPPDANAESPLLYSGDRYSDSKVDGERAAWSIARARGIPLTVIRPACTFGPRGAAWTLQPLERIREGMPVLIGAGRGICNPIYVDNLVDLIVRALKDEAAINESFIGSQGTGVEWRDFFGTDGRMLGLSPRAVPSRAAILVGQISSMYERVTGRPGPLSRASVAFFSHRVTFNVTKNARLLGYAPRISFEEGMRRTEAWLRERRLI